MPFINFTNVATMLLTLVVFLLALVLSKETKKSGIIATMLSVFLIILVCHAVELGTISNITEEMHYAMTRSILVDFVFIFLSFISYLWMDEIQAKVENIKSIDNSLDWFWKRV